MGLVSVNDLKGGMVLGQDIKNKQGNILLRKDTELSEKTIMGLRAWGVTEADVRGLDKEQMEEIERESLPREILGEIEKKLEHLFPAFGDNPLMKELYRAVKKIKLKKVMLKSQDGRDENDEC